MKQIILNWTFAQTEMPVDAYIKQMTEDGTCYLHALVPVSYGISQAGAHGPSHYINITKAIIVLNKVS